jgi:hypothetical protein
MKIIIHKNARLGSVSENVRNRENKKGVKVKDRKLKGQR